GLIAPAKVGASAGPVPAAVGALHPDRVVNLRPNPVDDQGRSLSDAEGDYSYQWTISRQGADGNWSTISTPSTYGAQVTPTDLGNYRAEVTMTHVGATEGTSGYVEFAIIPPVITIDELELVDDGHNTLDLRMKLTERIPHDDFTISI